ncbi:MAG: endonuclease III [Lachnospiraceae bacterium]|nr:endonuclease III [Lachnospiraceae bacterium]
MKETKKQLKTRVDAVLARLDEAYGTDVRCYLTHTDAWQLLIAVILSAQCTDARVNMVTPALFEAYPTPEAMGQAEVKDVERLIHSVGFYHNKAKNIVDCSRVIAEEYGGVVPGDIEELTKLPGVGRKTANVIRGNVYDDPSIVVDTHVKRISNKLGFTTEEDPVKIEFDLMKVLPKDHWIIYNIHIITLGRTICTARKPDCANCFLKDLCPSNKE